MFTVDHRHSIILIIVFLIRHPPVPHVALTAGKVKCKTFFSSCLMTASLLGQKKWFLITKQSKVGRLGWVGSLLSHLWERNQVFFMPLYLTFQYLKNGIYIHINITFGNLGFAIFFLGCLCIQGWGCSCCAQKRGS